MNRNREVQVSLSKFLLINAAHLCGRDNGKGVCEGGMGIMGFCTVLSVSGGPPVPRIKDGS